MSGTLRAQFQLDLADGMSAPIERIERVLQGLQQSLEALKRPDPFSQLMEPVPRATQAVEGLATATKTVTQAMEGATGATEALGEALGGTSEAAQAAANNLREIGAEAEVGADRAVSAMERVRRAVAGIGGIGGGGGAHGGAEHGGGLFGAAHNFHQSIESGVGRAFGAAAMGFGLIEPVHAAAEYNNTLTHVGIGLGIDDPTANAAFVRAQSMRLDALARQTGSRGTDLADALGFFSREGYSGARLDANMPVVARISTAYNAAPEAIAKTAFALQESMHITDGQLGGALASIALAGKSADLPFENIAPIIPQLTAQAGVFGMHGRSAVDNLAAATAVVRKSTGTDAHAIDDMRFLLSDLNQEHTARRFARYGVDMFAVEDAARKRGDDPLMAMVTQIDRVSSHGQNARVLGDLFRNIQSFTAAAVLLRNFNQYRDIHARTSGADQNVINRDYMTGLTSTLIQLQAFQEALSQINRRIGTGFAPVMQKATVGLDHFLDAWDRLDKALPKATPQILAIGGGILALAAATAALGAIWGPLVAGAGLLVAALGALLSPVTLVVAAIGGAVLISYELVKHLDAVGNAMMRLGHIIATMVRGIPDAAMSGLNFLENYAKDLWNDPTGTKNLHMHTPPLQPIGPGIPAHVVITHDGSLNVAPRSSPQVRVTTQRVPGTGRTVNRP